MRTFKKTKTERGFALLEFKDDYGINCSIQKSSSIEPHIWLGVDNVEPQIQYCDAKKLGLDLKKNNPESNDFGWCNYDIPKEVLLSSRMHLNKKQAKQIALKLLEFVYSNNL